MYIASSTLGYMMQFWKSISIPPLNYLSTNIESVIRPPEVANLCAEDNVIIRLETRILNNIHYLVDIKSVLIGIEFDFDAPILKASGTIGIEFYHLIVKDVELDHIIWRLQRNIYHVPISEDRYDRSSAERSLETRTTWSQQRSTTWALLCRWNIWS